MYTTGSPSLNSIVDTDPLTLMEAFPKSSKCESVLLYEAEKLKLERLSRKTCEEIFALRILRTLLCMCMVGTDSTVLFKTHITVTSVSCRVVSVALPEMKQLTKWHVPCSEM